MRRNTMVTLAIVGLAVMFGSLAMRPGVDLSGPVTGKLSDATYRDFLLDGDQDPINVTFISSEADDYGQDFFLFRMDPYAWDQGYIWTEVGQFTVNDTVKATPGLYKVVHPDDMGGLVQIAPGIIGNLGAGERVFLSTEGQAIDMGVVLFD